jgi:hypothetical protein
MPNLGSWVAPTLNVEELDKRIEELKNVQFWLEQNSRALSATIQALEVQKMTLATLKGMNFNLGDLAKAFTPKPAASAPRPEKPAEKAPEPPASTPEPEAEAAAPKAAAKPGAAGGAGMVDPLQLWGSLTQQFQQIAATALKDVSTHAATEMAKASARSAAKPAVAPAKKTAARKAPARKSAARKTSSKTTGK